MKSRKNRTRKVVLLILMIGLLIASGFARDSLFKSINGLLRAWDLDEDYYLPSAIRFLENYEYDTLLNLKWVLTFAFAALYFTIAVFVIRLLFGDRRYSKICLYTYIAVTIASGLFILFGKIFNGSSEKMYEFARYLMGMAQSPIILMVLIPAFLLAEKEKKNSE